MNSINCCNPKPHRPDNNIGFVPLFKGKRADVLNKNSLFQLRTDVFEFNNKLSRKK